jgi:hypothetical protein
MIIAILISLALACAFVLWCCLKVGVDAERRSDDQWKK